MKVISTHSSASFLSCYFFGNCCEVTLLFILVIILFRTSNVFFCSWCEHILQFIWDLYITMVCSSQAFETGVSPANVSSWKFGCMVVQNSLLGLENWPKDLQGFHIYFAVLDLSFLFAEVMQWRVVTTQLNTLRLRQNGCHFADNIFKLICLNENYPQTSNISHTLVANKIVDHSDHYNLVINNFIAY